jgi:hypothetical protein
MIKYLKTYFEAQIMSLDTLAFAKEDNYKDLKFLWDIGYGASCMDTIVGKATRRTSEGNETLESRIRNITLPEVAALFPGANVSYTMFVNIDTKPFIRLEAKAGADIDLTVNNLTHIISEYHVPASDNFSTVFLNTSLVALPRTQLLYLHSADKVEISRFNFTGGEEIEETLSYGWSLDRVVIRSLGSRHY